jgi:hypothetical protein
MESIILINENLNNFFSFITIFHKINPIKNILATHFTQEKTIMKIKNDKNWFPTFSKLITENKNK